MSSDDPTEDGIYPDTAKGGFKGPESCGIVKPANVISVSYGGQEADVTAAYQERECTEYGKLGMAGVSILYSSGDNGGIHDLVLHNYPEPNDTGVAGNGGDCLTASGKESTRGTRFNPGFPGQHHAPS